MAFDDLPVTPNPEVVIPETPPTVVMETRDAMRGGVKVGEVSLPEGTPEDVWTEKLALAVYVKPASTLIQVIENKVSASEAFGRQVVFDAKVGNVAQGVTQANKTKEVSDYLRMVARYLNEGSLYAAIAALDEMIVAEIPAELSPFVTVERLTATKYKIQDFLLIPRT